MSTRVKILARVAVFAALVFVFSYFSVWLYNVNLAFFIVFSAGCLWGLWPGIGTGVIGFFLWSNFNPFGPAPFPLLISQLIGISFSAVLGVALSGFIHARGRGAQRMLILSACGLASGFGYHLIVDVVDALLYQPFWPRLIGGLVFSLITIVSNCIIFPLFYPALDFLREREKKTIG
jgi:hypothetical protein